MNDAKTALSSDVPYSRVHREMKMHARRLSPPVFAQLLRIGQPRVVSLIVFTAVTGMLSRRPGRRRRSGCCSALSGVALLAMFRTGRIEQANFHDYRALRRDETPVVEV